MAGSKRADAPLFQHILVPLDGSARAERVLPHVRSLAEKYGSQITLLKSTPAAEHYVARSVAPVTSVTATGPNENAGSLGAIEGTSIGQPSAESVDLNEADRRAGEKYLRATALKLAAQLPRTKVTCAHPKGKPAAEIVRRAAQMDLIAMTTHGRTGLGRLVIGSVAEEVLRHAPCPVLLIRVL